MDMSKEELICRFNALHIDGMAEITDLNLLSGSYINLEYTLPNGQKVKFLKDEATYYANQSHHKGTTAVTVWWPGRAIFWSVSTTTGAKTRRSWSTRSYKLHFEG